jgi:hypothetical protein
MRGRGFPVIACAAALLGLAVTGAAGADERGLNRTGSISLSTNPVKLAEALVNLDVQANLIPQVSLFAFGEALLLDCAIKRSVHPDAVAHAGARWHFLASGKGGDVWDLNAGLSAGYTWSATPAQAGVIGVAEVGGRWLFWGPLYIYGRGLLTYALTTGSFIPGFEGHIGVVLN